MKTEKEIGGQYEYYKKLFQQSRFKNSLYNLGFLKGLEYVLDDKTETKQQ